MATSNGAEDRVLALESDLGSALKELQKAKAAREQDKELHSDQLEDMHREFETMRSTLMAMQMRAEYAEKELKGAVGRGQGDSKALAEEVADLKRAKSSLQAGLKAAAGAEEAKRALESEKELLRAKEQEMQGKMSEVKRQLDEFQERVREAEAARLAAENEAQVLRGEAQALRKRDGDVGQVLKHKGEEVEALRAQVEAEKLRTTREKDQRAALAAVAARSAQDLNETKAVVEGLKAKLEESMKDGGGGGTSMLSRLKPTKSADAELEKLRAELSQLRQAGALEKHAAEEARSEAAATLARLEGETRRAEAAEAASFEVEGLRTRVAELEGLLEEARGQALVGTPLSTKRQLAEARAQARTAEARRKDAERREEEMSQRVEDVTIAYQEAQAATFSLKKNLELSARTDGGTPSGSASTGTHDSFSSSGGRALKRNLMGDLEEVGSGGRAGKGGATPTSRRALVPAGSAQTPASRALVAVRGGAESAAKAVRGALSSGKKHGGALARTAGEKAGEKVKGWELGRRVGQPVAAWAGNAAKRVQKVSPALQMASLSVATLLGLKLLKQNNRKKKQRARQQRARVVAARAAANRAWAAKQAAAVPPPPAPAAAKKAYSFKK